MPALKKLLASILILFLAGQPALPQLQSSSRALARNPARQIPGMGITGLPSLGQSLAPTSRNLAAASLIVDAQAGPITLPKASYSSPAPALTAAQALAAQAQEPSIVLLPMETVLLLSAPTPAAAAQAVRERLKPIVSSIAQEIQTSGNLSPAGAHGSAQRQFQLLVGEKTRSLPVAVGAIWRGSSGLLPAKNAQGDSPKTDTVSKEPQTRRFGGLSGRLKVFKDPERNSAFWRFFAGEMEQLFGLQMYVVALPFFLQSFRHNFQTEALSAAAVQALNEDIRKHRSQARIAHWAAQALSYFATPLFTRDGQGQRRWLLRSALLRAAVLALIPTLFFASGLFTLQTAFWILLGLIAAQSFFQGLYVTMMSGSAARILGDESVAPEERENANAIRTVGSSIVAILAPAIAGKIASIRELFGKVGAGSAIIYGVYAAAMALSGLTLATIRMLSVRGERAPEAPREKVSAGGLLKSIGHGFMLNWKNPFLRTMLILNLVISLFSDPLVFNVFPEFVEGLIKANPNTLQWILHVPLLGWFMEGLTSTPMGFFGLLVAFSSLGTALASITLKPLRRLLDWWGFRSEESRMRPLYLISFLEVPAFWGMLLFPSFWSVLLLYGLQAFVVGFAALAVTGLNQKALGGYKEGEMNQLLAANSFISILAAILVTYLYGYVLTGIPVTTSLAIAGAAISVLGLLKLAAPWLMFPKEERSRKPTQAPKGESSGYPGTHASGTGAHGHSPLRFGL